MVTHERQGACCWLHCIESTDVVQHNEKIATIMLRVSGLHLIGFSHAADYAIITAINFIHTE